MDHPSSTSFERLEADAQVFARNLVKRKACPCCVSRALLLAGVALAYDSGTLPEVRSMLQSLLDASQQDASEPVAH